MPFFNSRAISALAFALTSAAPFAPAAADSPFQNYGERFQTVNAPALGAGSFFVVGDALTDGRLIAVTGLDVFLETAPGSSQFQVAAMIAGDVVSGSMDPSFVRISPGGSRVAIGAGFGKPVMVLDASLLDPASPPVLDELNAKVFAVGHDGAAWFDEDDLAISSGAFGAPAQVNLLDVTSDPTNPVSPVVVENIDGGSAGVAFDDAGRLYTANGFDNSPDTAGTSETGWIKAFEPAAWMNGPIDFETGGTLVADVLSGLGLDFDSEGNLLVGGGDAFGPGASGFLAVARAAAVDLALSSADHVQESDTDDVLRLDPLGDGSGFFSPIVNAATGELIVSDGVNWFATSGRPTGDLDGDCLVNGADLGQLLAAWGSSNRLSDLDGDGDTDGADLGLLLLGWNPGDAP